jgi:predicted lipid-binding transport protein (Tim44 family)
MKFLKLLLTITLITLLTTLSSGRFVSTRSKQDAAATTDTAAATTTDAAAAAASTAAPAASTAAPATNSTAATGVNATNAAGISVVNGHVTEAPYKVNSCDQVIEIEARSLTDMNDFAQKEDAFFTLSMYMVNKFQKKDPSTLNNSVMMDSLVNTPAIIPGSVSCLQFAGTTRVINMCMKDKTAAEAVITAYSDLMKCRMGDNLKSATASTIQRLLRSSCLGLDVNFDIKHFQGDMNKAKAALQAAINAALRTASISMKKAVAAAKTADTSTTAALDGPSPASSTPASSDTAAAAAKRRRRRRF